MSGDHKRKATAVAPARVIVTADDITVIVPDVLGKNESHKTGKNGRRFTSDATAAFRESVDRTASTLRRGGAGMQNIITSGAWRLEVIGVWPRQRATIDGHKVGFVCPMGDADASIPQALDALQRAGILDDDARVVEVRAWNLYRKDQRATIIRLVRVPDVAERDAAIAHLAEHVPADSPPATKKPRAKSPRRKAAAP